MPNSDHGGPPATRVIIIFVFYVNPQIPNIESFEAYGGLQILGGISSFVSSNFLSNAVRIMSGDPFFTGVMTIFIKKYMFVKVKGREEGREEGRKEGTCKDRTGPEKSWKSRTGPDFRDLTGFNRTGLD